MSINNDFWQQTRKAVVIDKARGYFTLPAFSIDLTDGGGTTSPWMQSSQIVGQFNFEADKNFTIPVLPLAPTQVNNPYMPFILCIRFRIGGTVYRYKIWSLEEEPSLTDPIPAPPSRLYVETYNGQVIKKNFILEIWTVSFVDGSGDSLNVSPSLTNAINFNISTRKVKQTLDESDTYEITTGIAYTKDDLTIPLPSLIGTTYPAPSSNGDNS